MTTLHADGANGPVGNWRGTYTCAQGLTALDLSVSARDFIRVRALFHFSAVASNPRVPEGCFEMQGTFDPATRHIKLAPGDWIMQPPGYVTVGLDGYLNASGTRMTGHVTDMAACTSFALRLASLKPITPEVCQAAPTVATDTDASKAMHWTSAALSH